MGALIENFEQRYLLGVDDMDNTHRAFVALVNRLGEAGRQEFITLFADLVTHTREHFAQEDRWMETSDFPAIREHTDEHQRILGELDRFAQRVASGSILIARSYITQQLPLWFDLHAKTMDSALASHLKK
ncbi:MAG: hemerythrin domain-containing protein [Candidatus Thiodiazotropha sp.]|nr:hemerythrin domain-containing protein [Candidatus Thiodiazotropha sp. (ex Lucina pensylvanica)]MBT3063300.1 hemerythrin domain-containing protein [Candidatus Thiodiazotropha sp. (ex Lucina pensylvanica)]MBV2094822.1 hemerythrin domain-containing protein [Candidatus Thiodiazotropha sp. (ex Codakia orbicularis)]PUB71936.1 MAG: hemerythrin [gamma proteobacterium symbiont of Ctena orbiculata]PUB75859.1 MAG: hemerythrin [gamma proteobacterium symbiont of Ctena orbiculata]